MSAPFCRSIHWCASAPSSSRRRPAHEPAALQGEGSVVIFKGATLVFLQALSVEPEVRLPHSDLLLAGKNQASSRDEREAGRQHDLYTSGRGWVAEADKPWRASAL